MSMEKLMLPEILYVNKNYEIFLVLIFIVNIQYTSIGIEPPPHIGSTIISPGLGFANFNKL